MLDAGKGYKYLVREIHRHWLTAAFLLGFVTDLILLNKVDDLIDNLILLFYVCLATTSMVLFYAAAAERWSERVSRFFKKYAPILMQYSFGGLLSGMLIFYGRSGDWLASAPFLLLILIVILSNEFIDKKSDRLMYNLALYFIGLFSYIVLVVPVVTGKMGTGMFLLSGLIALILVTLVVKLLIRVVPNFVQRNVREVILTIGGIYIGFNVLYFTNTIPPIPLSLTELQVVQSVVRTESGDYRVEEEQQAWYRRLPLVRSALHPQSNSIACFARVYAPTKLSTDVFHRWEYKNEEGGWEDYFRLGYGISGKNVGGYRGYTSLENFFPGVWRCSVESERGQVLGRIEFVISDKDKAITTKTVIK